MEKLSATSRSAFLWRMNVSGFDQYGNTYKLQVHVRYFLPYSRSILNTALRRSRDGLKLQGGNLPPSSRHIKSSFGGLVEFPVSSVQCEPSELVHGKLRNKQRCSKIRIDVLTTRASGVVFALEIRPCPTKPRGTNAALRVSTVKGRSKLRSFSRCPRERVDSHHARVRKRRRPPHNHPAAITILFYTLNCLPHPQCGQSR